MFGSVRIVQSLGGWASFCVCECKDCPVFGRWILSSVWKCKPCPVFGNINVVLCLGGWTL